MKHLARLILLGCLFSHASIAQKAKPEKHEPLKDSLDKYVELQRLGKIIYFAEQWANLCKKNKGEENIEYAGALSDWGDALKNLGRPYEAEPLLLRSIEIRKKVLGLESVEVSAWLNYMGVFYYLFSQYTKSEPMYLQALEIRKKIQGPQHLGVATVLNNLGALYSNLNRFEEVKKCHFQALEIHKKVTGPESKECAMSFLNLGVVYKQLGDYSEAEVYFQKSLETYQKALGMEDQEVMKPLQNLGILYFDLSLFSKAEFIFLRIIEICKKNLGPEHRDVAGSIYNLAGLYIISNEDTKAEENLLLALKIWKKTLGPEHPDVAIALRGLGDLYYKLGKTIKSEAYYTQAIEIQKKALGPNDLEVAESLSRLGTLYMDLGSYAKAEQFYLQALEIQRKVFGPDHQNVALSLLNMGVFYSTFGRYTKADPIFQQSLKINSKVLGNEHPNVNQSQFGLARFYDIIGKLPEACISFRAAAERDSKLILRNFPSFTDQFKEAYLKKDQESRQYLHTFYAREYEYTKEISKDAYDALLFYKGLLLNSSAKWKHRMRSSMDTTLSQQFGKWEALSNRIGKLISSTDSAELVQLKNLQDKAEKIEKDLAQKSKAFASLVDKKIYTWVDVQKKLRPGSAAIEIVRVRKPGIAKTLTDTSDPQKPTYHVKGLTDTIFYAAYIVTSASIHPELVLLKNGNDLEGNWFKYYDTTMRHQVTDNKSYNRFWKKISDRLGPGIKRVYFSPDGVFNSINLSTLLNPKTRKYLLEERDIRIVTSTKDLVTDSVTNSNPAYACLVGYPEYNTDKTKRAEIVKQVQKNPINWYTLNLERSNAYNSLPATKTEVKNISMIMLSNGWKVDTLLGELALEEQIKHIEKPRILHIATHGYFQPDSTKGSNPLVRSGLILTGANKTLSGEKDENLEDGILTAYEAMNLNLNNTDLVVLSACETGLGEIKNGEGVYGLQRAFKVAGAKSLIMSLWKVNDKASQELMVNFYKHWLQKPRTTKRAAFLKAQREMRANPNWKHPYYWGAFVMVGTE